MRRSTVACLLSALASFLFMDRALGHELFVKMDNYYLDTNAQANLRVLNGTFEASVGPLARKRMRDVSIGGMSRRPDPDRNDWVDVEKESHLPFSAVGEGTYVAGVSTDPTVGDRGADDFATYLKLEELPDTLAKYDKRAYPKGVRYRYSKHAKTIYHVGNASSTAYSDALGYPVEIVLMTNPSLLKAGDTLYFKAVYKKVGLADQLVYVGHGPSHADSAQSNPSTTQIVRTDKSGVAQFVITEPAVWYIHTNRMEKSESPGFDFESDRASLTFQVR